ncbi:MAG: hypothetical protein K2I98_02300 [Prevotella sp.]|nr:hypothetical protein [Prevotella sp.]
MNQRLKVGRFLNGSEGIADGEVQGVHVLEAGYVEIAAFPGVVGQVESDAPVDTHHEEVEIVAQSDALASFSPLGSLLRSMFTTIIAV